MALLFDIKLKRFLMILYFPTLCGIDTLVVLLR